MRKFNVYRHPTLGMRAVKTGFCWPAFFVGFFWITSARLWKWASIWLGLLLLVNGLLVTITPHPTIPHTYTFKFSGAFTIGHITALTLEGTIPYAGLPLNYTRTLSDKYRVERRKGNSIESSISSIMVTLLVSAGYAAVIHLPLWLLLGIRGNQWRMENFLRRDFKLSDTVEAGTKDAAVAKVAKANQLT